MRSTRLALRRRGAALIEIDPVAVLRRESNSWGWPLIALTSMFALAYAAALVAHTVIAAVS
ncbi:MAG: hypothetical protein ABIO83_09840 [Ilumatobacteraceae bacterium]